MVQLILGEKNNLMNKHSSLICNVLFIEFTPFITSIFASPLTVLRYTIDMFFFCIPYTKLAWSKVVSDIKQLTMPNCQISDYLPFSH